MTSTNVGTKSYLGDWTMTTEMARCEIRRTDLNLLDDWYQRQYPVRWIPRKSVVQDTVQRFKKLQLYPIFSGHAFRVGGSKK